VAYLSADRIAGRPATVADDLYAVAVVGYEALSGRRPFPQQNLAELARAVAERRYPPLATLRPDADPVLVAVIEHGLSGGFGSAAEMRAVLAGQAPMRPPTRVLAHPLPDPATTVLPRRRRRRPVLAAIGALVVVVLVVLAFVVDAASRTVAPQPAGTATSEAPPPPVTTSAPPPTSLVPAPVDEQGPPKGRGNGNGKGNGNGHKPKHGGG